MTNTTPTRAGFELNRVDTSPIRRWVGKCKECSAQCRVEGRNGEAHMYVDGRFIRTDFVVVTVDELVFACADNCTNLFACVGVCACGGRVKMERVHTGKKSSKHKCGAICRHAKGPSCDCLCGGANHGAG